VNLYNLDDPKLQFGTDLHVDNKFGLTHFGPFDLNEDRRPEKIVIGVIGSPESISGVVKWLQGIEQGISAKTSTKPNLFPRYPGIQEGSPFRTRLVFDKSLQDSILTRDYVGLSARPEGEERFLALAEAFTSRAKNLKDKGADLVVIAFPVELFPLLGTPANEDEAEEAEIDHDSAVIGSADTLTTDVPVDDKKRPARLPHFHDVLKAVAMQSEVPIQIVRPSTYDEKLKRKETDRYGKTRRLQDPATRAWNIMAAIYYKAGGIPWRIPRRDDDLRTCYLGISFYESLDRESLQTAIAQVFDERGSGVILKGGTAKKSNEDRQVHLEQTDIQELICRALKAYGDEHHHNPARLIIHKTSGFNSSEQQGVRAAADAAAVKHVDMVSLASCFIRLFRDGYYPPLRGTAVDLTEDQTLLYTRGTSPFYEEYPGLYVPKTLKLRFDNITSSKAELLQSALILTKMNWNNTQMDELYPITIRGAKEVGSILKHVPVGGRVEAHYKYYM
jgi:hypothetical protein